MSSAESETSGVFLNAQMAIPIRCALECFGHPQPTTPLKTNDSTANGFVHNNINVKRSKAWDMRCHWLREKQMKENFNTCW